MINRKNILLTSVGGLTGLYISKHLKKTSSHQLIGIDNSIMNPSINWVDNFYEVPLVNDNNFEKALFKIIKKEKIDIIIPITSYDMNFFTQQKIKNKIRDVKILAMSHKIHRQLSNKIDSYSFLNDLGLNTPKILDVNSIKKFPIIMKPIESSGSKNTVIINNKTDLDYWQTQFKNCFYTEYLVGKEYTVDCLFDLEGRCNGYNIRERVKKNWGAATISKNSYKIDLTEIIMKLENQKIIGPVNFQFKFDEKNRIIIFDFNTRFASGGLPLTVNSGFDIPNRLINLLIGKKIKKWKMDMNFHNYTMIRFFDEFFSFQK
jgi:carbamoyl-phosphate synthase large subunit